MAHFTHEVNIGKPLAFPKGSMIAMDRGDNDYDWYIATATQNIN
jgi:hypothetical protein